MRYTHRKIGFQQALYIIVILFFKMYLKQIKFARCLIEDYLAYNAYYL